MAEFLFWFLIFLLLITILAWPTWPYTYSRWPYTRGGTYRYAPSATAAAVILLLLFMFWLGIIAISSPWTAAPPPVVVD